MTSSLNGAGFSNFLSNKKASRLWADRLFVERFPYFIKSPGFRAIKRATRSSMGGEY
jgi:hypothetical protein